MYQYSELNGICGGVDDHNGIGTKWVGDTTADNHEDCWHCIHPITKSTPLDEPVYSVLAKEEGEDIS